MADPDGPRTPNAPRSLKPEDTQPTIPVYNPQEPKGIAPTNKEDHEAGANWAKNRYDEWKQSMLQAGIPVDDKNGPPKIWVVEESTQTKPPTMSQEDWEALQAFRGASDQPSGKWVPDPNGQLFWEAWQAAKDDAKGKFLGESASSGAAGAYVDLEGPKSKEIQRQWKDFEDRATTFYDLLADEQAYGMRADDQNWQNMAAQRDLGLASMPYYTDRPMSSALSNIVGPSLPDYVRPDYRLNASVGLPGAQGFDDPDYDQFGFPAYAFGTGGPAEPNDGIIVPPLKVPWPWGRA